jgi:hypothetical protein
MELALPKMPLAIATSTDIGSVGAVTKRGDTTDATSTARRY